VKDTLDVLDELCQSLEDEGDEMKSSAVDDSGVQSISQSNKLVKNRAGIIRMKSNEQNDPDVKANDKRRVEFSQTPNKVYTYDNSGQRFHDSPKSPPDALEYV